MLLTGFEYSRSFRFAVPLPLFIHLTIPPPHEQHEPTNHPGVSRMRKSSCVVSKDGNTVGIHPAGCAHNALRAGGTLWCG